MAFIALMQYCERLGRLDIMIEKMRSIHVDSSSWKMNADEKRNLLKTVAETLDKANDPQAFKVIKAYLNDFSAAQSKELEKEAHRCVILAIKARDMITFEELQNIPAVNQLQSSNKEVHEFLSLFTNSDAKGFKKDLPKFNTFLKNENLDKDELIRKKSYFEICKLSGSTAQHTNYKFEQLASHLDIDVDDVEEWTIEAIADKIIDAKIDQLNEEIVILSTIKRKIGREEWLAIQTKI